MFACPVELTDPPKDQFFQRPVMGFCEFVPLSLRSSGQWCCRMPDKIEGNIGVTERGSRLTGDT